MNAIYRLYEITSDHLFHELENIFEDYGYWISSLFNSFFRLLFYAFNDREIIETETILPYISSAVLAEISCFIITTTMIILSVKILLWIGKTFIDIAKDLKNQMKLNIYLDKKGGRKKIKI